MYINIYMTVSDMACRILQITEPVRYLCQSNSTRLIIHCVVGMGGGREMPLREDVRCALMSEAITLSHICPGIQVWRRSLSSKQVILRFES